MDVVAAGEIGTTSAAWSPGRGVGDGPTPPHQDVGLDGHLVGDGEERGERVLAPAVAGRPRGGRSRGMCTCLLISPRPGGPKPGVDPELDEVRVGPRPEHGGGDARLGDGDVEHRAVGRVAGRVRAVVGRRARRRGSSAAWRATARVDRRRTRAGGRLTRRLPDRARRAVAARRRTAPRPTSRRIRSRRRRGPACRR